MTPAGKDELARDVSQSAAELTTLLREHLRLIEDQLSPLLSPDVFEQIIGNVDKLIFSEVCWPRSIICTSIHCVHVCVLAWYINALAWAICITVDSR